MIWVRTCCFLVFSFDLLIDTRAATEKTTAENGSCAISYRRCQYWEFECDNHKCINMRKFCDGFADCPDGEDEIQGNRTTPDAVMCNNVKNDVDLSCVLPHRHRCDGILDCRDFADQSPYQCNGRSPYRKQSHPFAPVNSLVLSCPECSALIGYDDQGRLHYEGNDPDHPCSTHTFRCSSGKCLRAEQFCDGVPDCEDGSDEITERRSSDVGGLMCMNRWNNETSRCYLAKEYICDGIDHCRDREDECGMSCSKSTICSNGNCIAKRYLGDGRDDCGDSSDECPPSYMTPQRVFKCMDGTCLAYEKFCDGRVDCADGSDEIAPSSSLLWNISHHTGACGNELNALNLSCILPPHHVCDGYIHCLDHSDEYRCNNSEFFKCNNKRVTFYSTKKCNFVDDCHDSSDECMPDCNRTFTCLHTQKCIAFSRFCDGVDDCGDGSDEMTEEMLEEYGGVLCNNSHNHCWGKCLLPQQYICDGLDHCEERADECQYGCEHSFMCDGKCLERHHFCDGKDDCEDGNDERSIGPGFKCPVSDDADHARTCILPQYMINDSRRDCVSNADTCDDDPFKCFRCLDQRLTISTTQVCDGVFDCHDLSDECLCARNSSQAVPKLCECVSPGSTCSLCPHLQFSCGGSQCIEQDKVCDGTGDCTNNADEENCSKQRLLEKTKVKDFQCPKEDSFAVQCDGIPECFTLADECGFDDKVVNASDGRKERVYKCGNRTSPICFIHVPKTQFSVTYYHCPNDESEFLTPEMICNGVEDCVDKSLMPLTFQEVRKSSDLSVDEQYCPQRALCNLSRPLDGKKVSLHRSRICDGQIDCVLEEDESQELCGEQDKSRFYCESRARDFVHALGLDSIATRDPLFVPQSVVFDGKYDCWDGSDECPTAWFQENGFSSKYDMIKNEFLRVLVWLMAIFALLGNFVVAWHTLVRLYRMRRLSPMMRTNLILVLNLAFADFLMGVYLLALAIQNAKTSDRYCKADSEWRTSSDCASIGTLAMISIQSSVMFLVILTSYRVVAVLRPFRANNMYARYTVAMVIISWCVSIIVAVIPRSPMLEDYFTGSAWIMPSVDFFPTNQADKETLHRFVNQLKGLSTEGIKWQGYLMSHGTPVSDTWSAIRKALDELYPDFWPKINVRGYFGYYSHNSVCLPKIFVTIEDKAWAYSAVVMTFDLLAFLYVLIAYLVIYHDAAKTKSVNRKDEENKTMQARITRLVLTDFACWGPVCLIAFLSLAGVSINPEIYAFAAIVMLPINSALNPIIYSNVLHVVYSSCVAPIVTSLHKHVRRSRDVSTVNSTQSGRRLQQRTSVSRTSLAVTMSTNDGAHPMEGAILLNKLDYRSGNESA